MSSYYYDGSGNLIFNYNTISSIINYNYPPYISISSYIATISDFFDNTNQYNSISSTFFNNNYVKTLDPVVSR